MFFTIAFAFFLHLPVAEDTLSGVSYSLPIAISDTLGHRYAVVFGVDFRATDGFDKDLGEMPIPPPPDVAAFDVRMLDPHHRRQPYPGFGSYFDVRPFLSRMQIDSFYIRFQPANEAYPMRFSWPGQISDAVDSAFIFYVEAGNHVKRDMLKEKFFFVRDPNVHECMLITYGAKETIRRKKWRGDPSTVGRKDWR
jgi:hypothetical protein